MAHERTALPSICTVQAPQAAIPQPNLVPVIFRCSRSTHRSGVLPSTPTSLRWPLTVNATIEASQTCSRYFLLSAKITQKEIREGNWSEREKKWDGVNRKAGSNPFEPVGTHRTSALIGAEMEH